MRIKLHWKLTIVFCCAVILGLSVGYFYFASHLKKYIEQNFENNLKNRIFLAKDLVESQLNRQSLSSFADSLADNIGKQQNLRVTIISQDGIVLGDTDLTPEEINKTQNHLNRPEIQEAIIKGFGTSKRYSYTINKYLFYIAISFSREDDSKGFIRFAIPISYIDMIRSNLNQAILGMLLLAFILSLIFTFIISFIISRPLEEMAKVARNLAKGDFSKKLFFFTQDEIGDLSRALSYMSDQIKDKIEKIERENTKLDAILSSMFEGIMVVDKIGKILLVNTSLNKLFFIDLDVNKQDPLAVIRSLQIQDIVDQILLGKEKLISREVSINQPVEKIFKVNAVPIIREDILDGAVMVFHDITELRKLEKIRQDFVANVSHELKTPIASIKGYAETLLEGAIDDRGNAKEFINIIYQDSNRLANLIDDLLDLGKIESDKMKMFFVPIEIEPILTRCLKVLDKAVKDKKLILSVNIVKSISKIMADEKRIEQVFLNLLDNAIKYNHDRGSIDIKIFVNDNFVQIDITDTGIGIPERDILRIFERFYRVDKAHSQELGGTGLGLSIVKHIVLAHHGQVWVRSELAKGSTFSFTIPIA